MEIAAPGAFSLTSIRRTRRISGRPIPRRPYTSAPFGAPDDQRRLAAGSPGAARRRAVKCDEQLEGARNRRLYARNESGARRDFAHCASGAPRDEQQCGAARARLTNIDYELPGEAGRRRAPTQTENTAASCHARSEAMRTASTMVRSPDDAARNPVAHAVSPIPF